MSIAKFIAKSSATVAGAGLLAMSFVAALPAAAQTTSSTDQIAALQAQIASLQAALAAMQGGSTTTTTMSATFTRDLTVGSTGSDVTALQNWLIAKGFAIPAGATGYFGAQTKAALAAYQAANGISPAAGYFGPITRAKVGSSSSTTTTTTGGGTTTTTTGGVTLSGGEGSIDNFKIVGATNTSMNAADTEQVYGFEFKADGSDLLVNRVDFDAYQSGVTGGSNPSTRPWNIFQTATLMHGSTVVTTVDASNQNNWSQDSTAGNGNQIYRVRFDNLKDVVKEGNTADYYLSLTTQNAISDSNVGGASASAIWTVNLTAQGVRATDAMGLQQYSSATTPSSATVTVSNSTNGSLVVSTGSDNPQTTTVQGSSSTQTTGIVLTTFTIQAKNADVNIYTIPTTVATTSSVLSNQIRDLKLYQGSTLVDTESPVVGGSNSQIKFQNLNVKIPANTTQSFSVQADINKIDNSNFLEGASLAVSIPSSGWDAENSAGNQVSLTGSVTGNAITFHSVGLSIDPSPTTSITGPTTSGNGTLQTATFNFTFNVTAFGQDIYFSSTTNGFTPTQIYSTPAGGTGALVASSTAAATITSTADKSTLNNYVVHSGQTKSVTISFTKQGGSGVSQGILSTFLYGTTDAAPLANTYTFPNTYQTNQLYLSN